MMDYKSREDLIRDHWKRYGFSWDVNKWPRLKIPVRRKLGLFQPPLSSEVVAVPISDTLEFSFERGTLDGRPAYRIICEGIVVEERQL